MKIFKGGLGSSFSSGRRRSRWPDAGRGTIGDFNDDGDEDLAVPSTTTDDIHIFLGDTGKAAFVANHRLRDSGDEVNGLSNGHFDNDTRRPTWWPPTRERNSDNVVWFGSRPPEPVIGGTTPPSRSNNNTPEGVRRRNERAASSTSTRRADCSGAT